MIVVTTWAMVAGLIEYIGQRNYLLTALSALILILEVWVIAEAVYAIHTVRRLQSADRRTELSG